MAEAADARINEENRKVLELTLVKHLGGIKEAIDCLKKYGWEYVPHLRYFSRGGMGKPVSKDTALEKEIVSTLTNRKHFHKWPRNDGQTD